ncbi:MAG: hypothetical protein WBL68_02665 [Nitrososphaeraceae archaeon]
MNLILEIFIIFRFSASISLTTPIRGVFAVAVTAILVVSVVAASMLAETENVGHYV